MERPLNTVLGWRLPGWLLDWGPVAFVGMVGLSITVRAPPVPGWRLTLVALAFALIALGLRQLAPFGVMLIVLGISAASGARALTILPVLLAVFTVAEYSVRSKTVLAVAVGAAVAAMTPVIHGMDHSAAAILSHLVAIGLAVSAGLYLRPEPTTSSACATRQSDSSASASCSPSRP